MPHARSSPRATMSTFIDAMNAKPQNLATAVRCLDPTGRNPEAWSVTGKDLATQLKTVMDKIREVVLVDIPDAPAGSPHVWFSGRVGDITLKRVDEAPKKPCIHAEFRWRKPIRGPVVIGAGRYVGLGLCGRIQ